MRKLLSLIIIMIISVGCSNKGNGDKFYVELYERSEITAGIIHSKLDCKAIKEGVEIYPPGKVPCAFLICSKCMDEDLFEIATNWKENYNDDDDDDDF